MKYLRFPFLVALLLLQAMARADVLGGAIEITPVEGWVQAELPAPGGKSFPFPTLCYVPKDGRNANLLLTLVPNELSQVTDLDSLKKFHRAVSARYLPNPAADLAAIERRLPQGMLVYASFVDPDMVGKPVQRGSFKVATSAVIYLPAKGTVHVTLFTDSKEGADLQQGLKIIQSASPLKAESSAARAGAVRAENAAQSKVGLPALNAALRLPARFHETPRLNSKPGYFSYADSKNVILSGWLDRAANFSGMREFWAKEKSAMTADGILTVADESIKIINGWNAVLYTVQVKDSPPQKNIRACRVVGDTWADVHLSTMLPEATWKDLEDVVKELTLAPK